MANKILCFSGSSRKDSLNRKLANAAARQALSLGMQATTIDLADYPLELYNGDQEQQNGLPPAASELQILFAQHDALIIASPEYNGSFSPLLKNTLDWISRPPAAGNEGLKPYQYKVAGLLAASPGGFGGLRGLVPLRMLLGNLGVTVVSAQLAIPGAHKVFNDSGELENESTLQGLDTVLQAVKTTHIDDV